MNRESESSEIVTAECIEELVSGVLVTVGGYTDEVQLMECKAMTFNALRSYPDKYLPTLKAHFESLSPDVALIVAKLIASGHDDYTDVEEYAYFLPLIQVQNKTVAEGILHSLRDYMHEGFIVPAWDYSKTDERVRKQALAIMDTAAAIYEATAASGDQTHLLHKSVQKIMLRIVDEDLIRAVVNEPEESESIRAVIRSYGVIDYRGIKSILDGIKPALVGGAL